MNYKTAWMRRWRAANPEKDRAKRKQFAATHPHYSRNYWRLNKEKLQARINWEVRKAAAKLGVAFLSDDYIRRKLSFKTGVPMSAWPDAMVQLKRAHLQLLRLCHNRKTLTN